MIHCLTEALVKGQKDYKLDRFASVNTFGQVYCRLKKCLINLRFD